MPDPFRVALAVLVLASLGCGKGPTHCVSVHDCQGAQRCAAGTCQEPGAGPPGVMGDSCSSDAECTAGLSCSLDATGFPSGMCTSACDAAACASGSSCADLSSTSAASKVCAPTCASDAQCRHAYGCCPAFGGVCLPGALCPQQPVTCSTVLLLSGGTAGPSAPPSSCQRPVQPSVLPSSQVQTLGTHAVGDVISFNVPSGTGGLSIVSQGRSTVDSITYQGSTRSNTVVPTLIKGPDGTVLYDDSASAPADLSGETIVYATDSPGTGALSIPNSTPLVQSTYSSGGLPAGNWQFTVSDNAYECAFTSGCDGGTTADTYDVSVLLKPGIAASGTLDMGIYLVGTPGITAASAPTDPSLSRMVQTIGILMARGGVCLGTVSFFDVPSWAQTRYASIDAEKDGPCTALNQLFTLSKPGNSVNIFLVKAISSSSGLIVGLDGTIPGPSTMGGTIHSGAIVSAQDLTSNGGNCSGAPDLSCGADFTAVIASHETGHWLGLYHPTEMDGMSFDSLSDTPTCKCSDCAPGSTRSQCGASNNPAEVDASNCNAPGTNCAGGDNLMFWQLSPGISHGRLSPQQGQVMRSNLAVH